MTTPTIDRIAQQHGVTPEVLIRESLHKHGSIRQAAQDLKVSHFTLQRWLKLRGFTVKKCARLEKA
jgi:transcriptional regulator with PAS, ATPase and Fis domain